jgi:hypothetical protein
MLTTLLRRVLAPAPQDLVSRERRVLATGLERLGDRADRSSATGRAIGPPIVHRDVAAAVAAPAASMAEDLRDPALPVDDGALTEIREFLTDGSRSPLYDRDPLAAVVAVAELERRVRRPR